MISDEAEGDQPERPFYLLGSEKDVAAVDLERPISDCDFADVYELRGRYAAAVHEAKTLGDESAARIYAMMEAILGFHFQPNEPSAPFQSMFVGENGRSPEPQDFRGYPCFVLSTIYPKVSNPLIRARIADTCWFIDHAHSQAAIAAVDAYVDAVEVMRDKKSGWKFDATRLSIFDACDLARRALQIGYLIGSDKDCTVRAKTLALELREFQLSPNPDGRLLDLYELDLDFRITDPLILAGEIEKLAIKVRGYFDLNLLNFIWKLAARGYHYSKSTENADRCRAEAAECLVRLADSHGSPLFSSHWLQAAIAEYMGVKGRRGRKTELRHKLIDVQSHIPDEMTTIQHEWDTSDITTHTENLIKDTNLMESLRVFALLTRSPDIQELREDAKRQIEQHPLSSLFPRSQLDYEGKVVHRSGGAGGIGEASDEAINEQIAQGESIRRKVVAIQINIARLLIFESHLTAEDDFFFIVSHSPFVPVHHVRTYARGFAKFFQGDLISALYILVPQLENSLRHVLKNWGHDVTKMIPRSQTQEDRTISSLFEHMRSELEEIFGVPLVADIERVFLLKSGPYIRHQVAHGTLSDFAPFGSDAAYACWLIFHICCLPLLPRWVELAKAHSQMYGG